MPMPSAYSPAFEQALTRIAETALVGRRLRLLGEKQAQNISPALWAQLKQSVPQLGEYLPWLLAGGGGGGLLALARYIAADEEDRRRTNLLNQLLWGGLAGAALGGGGKLVADYLWPMFSGSGDSTKPQPPPGSAPPQAPRGSAPPSPERGAPSGSAPNAQTNAPPVAEGAPPPVQPDAGKTFQGAKDLLAQLEGTDLDALRKADYLTAAVPLAAATPLGWMGGKGLTNYLLARHAVRSVLNKATPENPLPLILSLRRGLEAIQEGKIPSGFHPTRRGAVRRALAQGLDPFSAESWEAARGRAVTGQSGPVPLDVLLERVKELEQKWRDTLQGHLRRPTTTSPQPLPAKPPGQAPVAPVTAPPQAPPTQSPRPLPPSAMVTERVVSPLASQIEEQNFREIVRHIARRLQPSTAEKPDPTSAPPRPSHARPTQRLPASALTTESVVSPQAFPVHEQTVGAASLPEQLLKHVGKPRVVTPGGQMGNVGAATPLPAASLPTQELPLMAGADFPQKMPSPAPASPPPVPKPTVPTRPPVGPRLPLEDFQQLRGIAQGPVGRLALRTASRIGKQPPSVLPRLGGVVGVAGTTALTAPLALSTLSDARTKAWAAEGLMQNQKQLQQIANDPSIAQEKREEALQLLKQIESVLRQLNGPQ